MRRIIATFGRVFFRKTIVLHDGTKINGFQEFTTSFEIEFQSHKKPLVKTRFLRIETVGCK